MHADVETDVLILLYDVARHMRTHADQMAREHGLTRAQWIILVRLERRPDLSQNELAKKLYGIMTRGIDAARMRALQHGLRKMKDNISSTRRLAAA